ncbi:hypothetical protein SLEP1_g51345 [Rubroshorea leprosula]|uniref:Uncharacterized protein n=1 Tax=Rubroshorea leprosula TaxID=152421 RepID=A0AAV5M4D9_9ROSI|nr:hypothetical protein SLEP1_g51345 [Rubroshorea leprosula]
MEKASKQIYKMLRTALPRAASPIAFQVSPPRTPPRSPPYIPRKPSPTTVSLVPKEARRKSKNESLDAAEPTSPKVSCMGQIKGLKRKQKKKLVNKSPPTPESVSSSHEEVKRKPNLLSILFFKGNKKFAEKVSATEDISSGNTRTTPSLGEIKQFASGRGVLSDFVFDEEMMVSVCVDNPLYEEKEETVVPKAEITEG